MKILLGFFCLVIIYVLIGVFLALKQKKGKVKPNNLPFGNTIVNPGIYDADYYLNAYSGNENKYIASLNNLPISLNRCFILAAAQPGEKVLDLGCGRGELAYHCVINGCSATALDYSDDAVKLAQKTKKVLPGNLYDKMTILQMDFIDLDESEKFDVIFIADLVEHLYDWQLERLFEKAKKILRKETGRIIIHTAPNRIFINVIFPLKRILNWPGVIAKKKDFFYKRDKYFYDLDMHVNEQTPVSLKRHLKGFKTRVWCDDGSANVISLLTGFFGGADIWAIARL
jgi:2-polyprenyl-3-methyl-5-hydroxy-6-metoxy-1,4-benzoquinol methylase